MRALPPMVERVLRRTPVAHWRHYAVIVDSGEGGAQLMTRGELAPWLRAADLHELADEAAARAARPSTGLLLLTLTREGPRFHVLGGEQRRPGVPRGRTRP